MARVGRPDGVRRRDRLPGLAQGQLHKPPAQAIAAETAAPPSDPSGLAGTGTRNGRRRTHAPDNPVIEAGMRGRPGAARGLALAACGTSASGSPLTAAASKGPVVVGSANFPARSATRPDLRHGAGGQGCQGHRPVQHRCPRGLLSRDRKGHHHDHPGIQRRPAHHGRGPVRHCSHDGPGGRAAQGQAPRVAADPQPIPGPGQ